MASRMKKPVLPQDRPQDERGFRWAKTLAEAIRGIDEAGYVAGITDRQHKVDPSVKMLLAVVMNPSRIAERKGAGGGYISGALQIQMVSGGIFSGPAKRVATFYPDYAPGEKERIQDFMEEAFKPSPEPRACSTCGRVRKVNINEDEGDQQCRSCYEDALHHGGAYRDPPEDEQRPGFYRDAESSGEFISVIGHRGVGHRGNSTFGFEVPAHVIDQIRAVGEMLPDSAEEVLREAFLAIASPKRQKARLYVRRLLANRGVDSEDCCE
jgi:hypothetical protein